MTSRWRTLTLIVALAGGLAACGGGSSPASLGAPSPTTEATTDAPTPAATASVASTCTYTKTGTAAKAITGLPPTTPSTTPKTATLATTRGPITIRLSTEQAPCTTGSFAFLAAQKYFDGTACHRLTTEGIFVLQCGDPSGTGGGGPGYQFADENLTGATYPAGTLAMANAGPGTNGSQFFLVYKDTQLPPSYTPFGTITKGLDVVTAVAAGGASDQNGPGDGPPNLKISLTTVRVA